MNTNTAAILRRAEAQIDPGIKIPTNQEIDNLIRGTNDAVLQRVSALGYVPPSHKSQFATNSQKGRELLEAKLTYGSLASVLRNAGIRPFTKDSVEVYQKAMANPRRKLQFLKTTSFGISSGFWLTVCMVGSFLSSFACYYLAGMAVNDYFTAFKPVYFLWFPAVLFSLLMSLVFLSKVEGSAVAEDLARECLFVIMGPMVWIIRLFGPSLVSYEWRKIPLAKFKKDIPRPILETVAEINSRCPNATFCVEELQRKPDPFLIVELGFEKYYVEVWNEAKFDGTRLA